MRIFLTALFLLTAVTGASAQNVDVIKERQAAFKSYLDHVKPGSAMMKGEAEFDLDKAKAIFNGYAEISKKFATLFPDDSKEGAETRALPAIWEKKDEFLGIFDKLATDASAAANSITDEASFKAAWPTVMGNCGTCHKAYRAEKK